MATNRKQGPRLIINLSLMKSSRMGREIEWLWRKQRYPAPVAANLQLMTGYYSY
jgi:hypothetical protein